MVICKSIWPIELYLAKESIGLR